MADPADLARVPLFASLSDGEREELAAWFEVRTVGAGVKLASEGAAGYAFYLLVDGSAVVTSGGTTVATFAPGDFFGEMAIVGDSRRSATVVTSSPAKLLVMFGTEFRRLQQAYPAIAAEFERVTEERRRELQQLGTDPSRED
ncbi:MAG: cyclic nucleotide-binding domain-containing protein [Gaiellaceae bacterium]